MEGITSDADSLTFIKSKIETNDINQDATSIQTINPKSTEDLSISIDKNKLLFADNTDGSYTIISQVNGYIYLDYRLADGSKDGDGIRLYNTQEEAQTYLNSLTDMNDSGFTAEMLYDDSFFNTNTTFVKPEAIEQINFQS